jgi:hypothetical protein
MLYKLDLEKAYGYVNWKLDLEKAYISVVCCYGSIE